MTPDVHSRLQDAFAATARVREGVEMQMQGLSYPAGQLEIDCNRAAKAWAEAGRELGKIVRGTR